MTLTALPSYLQNYKFENDRFMYPIETPPSSSYSTSYDNMKIIYGGGKDNGGSGRFQDLGVVGGLVLNSNYDNMHKREEEDEAREEDTRRGEGNADDKMFGGNKCSDPAECNSIPEELFMKLFNVVTNTIKRGSSSSSTSELLNKHAEKTSDTKKRRSSAQTTRKTRK
jgi:hypothetical protein